MGILYRPSVIELFIRFFSFIFSLFPLPAKLNQNAAVLIICCQPIALNFAIWSFLVKSCCCEGFISSTFQLWRFSSLFSIINQIFVGLRKVFFRHGKLLFIFAGAFQDFSTLRWSCRRTDNRNANFLQLLSVLLLLICCSSLIYAVWLK